MAGPLREVTALRTHPGNYTEANGAPHSPFIGFPGLFYRRPASDPKRPLESFIGGLVGHASRKTPMREPDSPCPSAAALRCFRVKLNHLTGKHPRLNVHGRLFPAGGSIRPTPALTHPGSSMGPIQRINIYFIDIK